MSGFEIAGVVLGAFPIAIRALDDYREVAKRLKLWNHIRAEYTRCRSNVEFHRVTLASNLRQLILPLLVDDVKVNQLLSDPGGQSWKEPAIEGLIKQRLGDTHELYLKYIEGMERVMEKLNKELSVDSNPVQRKLNSSVRQVSTTHI
jgi:hypothetical protein